MKEKEKLSTNIFERSTKFKKFKVKELKSSAMFGLKETLNNGEYEYTAEIGTTFAQIYKISKYDLTETFKILPSNIELIDERVKNYEKSERKK